jgi:hypothetical protein
MEQNEERKHANGKQFYKHKVQAKSATKVQSFVTHKCRKPIEEIALKLPLLVRGVRNYYCKFWTSHTETLWHAVKMRVLK